MPKIIEANNHSFSLDLFHADLLRWDAQFRRVYPWRTTDNPFHIMMAELMLRRTQARQVVKVYKDFIAKYPDAHALAAAPAKDVARSLFSLGLAWRVPAFQQIAHTLVEQYDGSVPSSYDALISLPGVGDYVASAVSCFAFGQDVSIIDTNTVRVAGRLFGIPTHAESCHWTGESVMSDRLTQRLTTRTFQRPNHRLMVLQMRIAVHYKMGCHPESCVTENW